MKSPLKNTSLPVLLIAPAVIMVLPDILLMLSANIGIIEAPESAQSITSLIPQPIPAAIGIAGLVGVLIYLIQQLESNKQK